jgi:hypothetical protein
LQNFLAAVACLPDAERADELDVDSLGSSKGIGYALKMFSSFDALCTLLECETQGPPARPATSVFALLHRLVMAPFDKSDDADATNEPILDQEAARLAGLELLSVLCACLDSFLLLDQRLQLLPFLHAGSSHVCVLKVSVSLSLSTLLTCGGPGGHDGVQWQCHH